MEKQALNGMTDQFISLLDKRIDYVSAKIKTLHYELTQLNKILILDQKPQLSKVKNCNRHRIVINATIGDLSNPTQTFKVKSVQRRAFKPPEVKLRIPLL